MHLSVAGAANVASRLAAAIPSPVGSGPILDFDRDCEVDLEDYALFSACLGGPNSTPAVGCTVDADMDADNDVDLADVARFQQAFSQ